MLFRSVLTPSSATICPGVSVTLSVSGASTFSWTEESSPQDTIGIGSSIIVSPDVSTNYLVTGIEGMCKKTDTVPVTVASTLVVDFTAIPDTASILNPAIVFTGLSGSVVESWQWSFGDGDSSNLQNPLHTYPDTGSYNVWLIVSDSIGCTDSIMHSVYIRQEYILFAPNTFSPNGDGKNEEFIPKGIGLKDVEFEMYIYDRWGDLIYETTDIKKPWDGTANKGQMEAQEDVYVWLVYTKEANRKKHQYVGHVTLIR